MRTISYFLFLLTILNSTAVAQWSSDPSVNLTICDTTGEQSLAKIASTDDGYTYISWFDDRNGSYAVYLQRLNLAGNKTWANDGLLVSDNPQSSSLMNYDLIADAEGNAVVVFTDTRNNGALNVFAYRISPTGNFLWGADGVSLSTSSDFQAIPVVTQTTDGNFVVAWILPGSPYKVALQKLSPTGNKLWGTDPIYLFNGTVGYNYPVVVPSDSNSVIVMHTNVTGNFPAQTVKLGATKVNANRVVSWNVDIQTQGWIAAFSVPKVISDKKNGAIIAWHDDRNSDNLQSAFAQRISSAGLIYFPENGMELSLAPGEHKFNPVPAFDSMNDELYLFWVETNSNQSANGISGQKLSLNGERQWTDNGKIFKPLSAPNTTSLSRVNVQYGGGQAYVFYLEGNAGGMNTITEGFACNTIGDFVWTGNFVTLSNATTQKLQMVSTIDPFNNCNLAWGDDRTGSEGIYAQDINPDGQLGNPVIPVELSSFNANVNGDNVELIWTTASETNNNGFQVERRKACTQLVEVAKVESFNVVGFVNGNGTSTELNHYSFKDENLTAGKYIYRLKQIDYDGSFEYSNEIEVDVNVVNEFVLYQNYPNPFNPTTKIKFTIPDLGFTTLKIYDVLGNEIATLINEEKQQGEYEVEFYAMDGGSKLSSGVYFYQLRSGSFSQINKMILMK